MLTISSTKHRFIGEQAILNRLPLAPSAIEGTENRPDEFNGPLADTRNCQKFVVGHRRQFTDPLDAIGKKRLYDPDRNLAAGEHVARGCPRLRRRPCWSRGHVDPADELRRQNRQKA